MPAAACCVLQAVTTWPQWQANFGIASGDDLLYIDINNAGRITRSDAEAMRCSLWDEIRMWMDDNGRWVHEKPSCPPRTHASSWWRGSSVHACHLLGVGKACMTLNDQLRCSTPLLKGHAQSAS